MKVIVCENYKELSEKAAEFVCSQVILKPNCVLGMPTGSTPIGMYEEISKMNLDFSEVRIFNLDEYYPISRTNNQSYYYFMNEHLYSKVNVKPENIHIPNGEAKDCETECKEYDRKIDSLGGIDLQILGIGENGHIGFNEPDSVLTAGTHLTKLTESTIKANSRFFASEEDVPKNALTMGISSILCAKKIVVLASGSSKNSIVSELIKNGDISTSLPVTILKTHPDVVLICDKDAYNSR